MDKYIILLDKKEMAHVGSDMNQRCHFKSMNHTRQQAVRMLHASIFGETAWLLKDYTQKLCEMDVNEFSEYVRTKCTYLAIRPYGK